MLKDYSCATIMTFKFIPSSMYWDSEGDKWFHSFTQEIVECQINLLAVPRICSAFFCHCDSAMPGKECVYLP